MHSVDNISQHFTDTAQLKIEIYYANNYKAYKKRIPKPENCEQVTL